MYWGAARTLNGDGIANFNVEYVLGADVVDDFATPWKTALDQEQLGECDVVEIVDADETGAEPACSGRRSCRSDHSGVDALHVVLASDEINHRRRYLTHE